MKVYSVTVLSQNQTTQIQVEVDKEEDLKVEVEYYLGTSQFEILDYYLVEDTGEDDLI